MAIPGQPEATSVREFEIKALILLTTMGGKAFASFGAHYVMSLLGHCLVSVTYKTDLIQRNHSDRIPSQKQSILYETNLVHMKVT